MRLFLMIMIILAGCSVEQSYRIPDREDRAQVVVLHKKSILGGSQYLIVALPDFEKSGSIGYKCFDKDGNFVGSLEYKISDKEWYMTPVEELGFARHGENPPKARPYGGSISPRQSVFKNQVTDRTIILEFKPYKVLHYDGTTVDGELIYCDSTEKWHLLEEGTVSREIEEYRNKILETQRAHNIQTQADQVDGFRLNLEKLREKQKVLEADIKEQEQLANEAVEKLKEIMEQENSTKDQSEEKKQ